MSLTPSSTSPLNRANSIHRLKPKILHIVGDKKMGGVKSTMTGLINSEARTAFNFSAFSIVNEHPLIQTLKLRPEVIICHHPCRLKVFPHFVLLKQFNPQAKIIIHEHGYSQGYETYNISSQSRFHGMLRLFYGLADHVVAISHAQGEWMQKYHLVTPEKLTVIHQCPPLHKFLTVKAKPRGKVFVLGAYGRFCFHKGFDVLLRALKLLPNLPLKLYLGGEGPQEVELKEIAANSESVEFLGRIDDVPGFLQNCDAVVIPSRWEPWGNVCLEAKAAARPVIASGVDGLTEQINDNCGLLVPPDDPEALAKAVEYTASLSAIELQNWGNYGRELVKQNWEQYIDSWQDLLLKVLQKK